MKKITVVLLAVALLLCAVCAFAESTETKFELPVLLTSVGQSADYQMVGVAMKNAKIEYSVNNVATEADLAGIKTLILAIGGSSKGLGAAGIDANQELERVNALIAAAKAAEIKIIALHVGGEARRGELSDKFIVPAVAASDYCVAVAAGDKDGLISNTAKDAGIEIRIIDSLTQLMTVLPELF